MLVVKLHEKRQVLLCVSARFVMLPEHIDYCAQLNSGQLGIGKSETRKAQLA